MQRAFDRFVIRRGPAIAFALLILSIVWALLLPIYSDEITWRYQLGRVFQDDWVDRFVGETCGENTRMRPPMFMWPVRVVSSYWTSVFSDPRVIRIAGVALAVAAAFLFRRIIRVAEPRQARRATMETIAWLMLGLGVLPWALTMSRPEQPILLLLLGAIALALSARARGGRFALVAAAGIALFAIWSQCYHVKALFYLPTFLACLWIACWRRVPAWVPVVLTLAVLAATASAYGYWSTRFQCPADHILRAKVNRENLTSVLFSSGFDAFLRLAPTMLTNALPFDYIKPSLPNNDYMSAWLPPLNLPWSLMTAWRMLVFWAWLALIAFGGASLVTAIRQRRLTRPTAIVALTLIATLLLWAALQSSKNAYECALYLPVVLLAAMLLHASCRMPPRFGRALLVYVAPVAIMTQLAMFVLYTPRLMREIANVGYLPSQYFSLSTWTFPAYRERAIAAAAQCGIRPGAPLRHLAVDDGTYFVFADSYRPLHYVGVTEFWTGEITEPSRYLRRIGSSGAVLACKYLSRFPQSRAAAIETDGICCIPGAK